MRQYRRAIALLLVASFASGCTSRQRLAVDHYRQDQTVLTDGEEVEVKMVDGLKYEGKVAKREPEAVTLQLTDGASKRLAVAQIEYFEAEKFSGGKTALLVVAVAGGIALIWIIVATVLVVSTIVVLPLAIFAI